MLILSGLIAASLGLTLFLNQPSSKSRRVSDYFVVSRGMPSKQIVQRLHSLGITDSPLILYWSGRILNKWDQVKAGEYSIQPQDTPLEIFDRLTSGISISRPFTLNEGKNTYELATLMESRGLGTKKEALELIRSPDWLLEVGWSGPLPPSAEGYLFPDTYFFTRGTPAKEVLKAMGRRFLEIWTPEFTHVAQKHGFSRHQLVTLASMIEKETGVGFERPMISSVFHNRLKKRMRLQSDPTTIYGIWETYDGNLRKQDLLTPSPYNTYTLPGLPSGPIGNPGKEALLAALHPESTEYLYFVSQNDGTHAFTRTYQEHLAAVRVFQLNPKAREGKSWRDQLKNESPPQ